jgi:hypothetical protein
MNLLRHRVRRTESSQKAPGIAMAKVWTLHANLFGRF